MSSSSASPLKCFCGRTYVKPIDLEEHRRARGHFTSHVCGKYCNHPPVTNANAGIRECGNCGKICERLDILEDHRIATGHGWCSDCDLPFQSQSALKAHRETEVHASEFKCCDCNKFFKDIHALNAHMASAAHRKPLQPKPLKMAKEAKNAEKATAIAAKCSGCQRTFRSSQSLRQHCESLKHKPLSALRCPIGKGCRGKFASPSALLHHLESGNCQSGMNRDEIYRIVQSCDQDHAIHSLWTPTLPSSPDSSADTSSPCSVLSLASPDDESDWSLVTPALSEGSAEGSLMQWSLLEDSQSSLEGSFSAHTTIESKFQCPVCPEEHKCFATAKALQQHLDSPVHRAKVYCCPTIVSPATSSKAQKEGRTEKRFSTLGGLVQHLESGACQGGKRTLFFCIDLIQRHFEQVGFGGVCLLLPGLRG